MAFDMKASQLLPPGQSITARALVSQVIVNSGSTDLAEEKETAELQSVTSAHWSRRAS